MENKQPKQVKCPQCGRLAFYNTENKFRPFCSERCRLIDLGQWASESYRVASEENTSSISLSEVDFDSEQE